MDNAQQEIKTQIIIELNASQTKFHELLNSLSEEDFQSQSLNPGWTNGEILAHMTFGFMIVNVLFPMAWLWGKLPKSSSKLFAWLLNALTTPFNWFNALGARMQGKIFTRKRVGDIFDLAYFSLLKKVDSLKEHEWKNGMYYPVKWDFNFSEFMTLEKLFLYPVLHFKFHLTQIAYGKDAK